ncbi:CDP-glycerol glycerophosphotransferase family protein [Microcella alkaliphila]|uniref:CDP-glycerol:poly(Glycerophosphate) glycerophosphotransferase n=1 Tax=Microcella alkaliphila TaxID=279828 RepID=A0A0U5BCB3_9MICO|nr:CDP-glycerol glycerophosphotransferase family protein [Microcella alkaliphila]BAU31887.1 CDP-glycerol:poly(glycerophosphate) glycerophosphotransferase [Microcella alkaliphila]
MNVGEQLKTARRVISRLLRQRRNRLLMDKRMAEVDLTLPNDVEVAVYFADGVVNLYQVRQWFAPLAELAKTRRVAIITRSPGATLALLDESPVPVAYCRTVLDLEQFVAQNPTRIVMYVNQNAKNFQMFRYGRMWHVFINHGESDKMYMTTNQYKAYDYAFIAGQAAHDRLSKVLWGYDLETRALRIGRPQADHFAGELPYTPDDRTVVLYAPTWEGDRPAASYGSIASHGEAIVSALLATGRHRVIYRPHPRSGVLDRDYGQAHRRIVQAIEQANASDPAAQHIFDDGPSLGWQLAAADVAICDISAMIYDRLATGKPLLVTRPLSADALVDTGGYLSACEWLTADAASEVVPALDRVLTDADAHAALQHWASHYFGDTTPGAATARFHAAIDQLIDEWHAAEREHRSDPVVLGTEHDADDPLDDEALSGRAVV